MILPFSPLWHVSCGTRGRGFALEKLVTPALREVALPRKKRDYHSQVPASEDAELAKALLAVLHQHSDRQANDNDYVREPPRKKARVAKRQPNLRVLAWQNL